MPAVEGKKGFPAKASGWIDLEDEVLRRAHQKHGDEGRGKWVKISGYFIKRKSNQCRKRWECALNPAIKRTKQGGSGPSISEKDIELNYKELISKSSLVTEVSVFCLHTQLQNSLS